MVQFDTSKDHAVICAHSLHMSKVITIEGCFPCMGASLSVYSCCKLSCILNETCFFSKPRSDHYWNGYSMYPLSYTHGMRCVTSALQSHLSCSMNSQWATIGEGNHGRDMVYKPLRFSQASRMRWPWIGNRRSYVLPTRNISRTSPRKNYLIMFSKCAIAYTIYFCYEINNLINQWGQSMIE